MLMKVFNKGQVVIPSEIRKDLGIEIGDMLEVSIDKNDKSILMIRTDEKKSRQLAGSLSEYNKGNRLPAKKEMRTALSTGMTQGFNDN